MLFMIERIIRMEKPVRLALIECGSKLTFTDCDFKQLNKLKAVLEPAKLAVERLSRRDATLLTAERINDTVFESLESAAQGICQCEPNQEEAECMCEPNEYAETFQAFLKAEIDKRRPADLVHLMEYLNDSSYIKSTKKDSFGHAPNKTKMMKV